jgi:hypothetical protein
MPEVMTRQRMESEFDSEWILVGDPELSPTRHVVGGTVLFHSQDRDEVYRVANVLRPSRSAILYVGKPPPGMEYLL